MAGFRDKLEAELAKRQIDPDQDDEIREEDQVDLSNDAQAGISENTPPPAKKTSFLSGKKDKNQTAKNTSDIPKGRREFSWGFFFVSLLLFLALPFAFIFYGLFNPIDPADKLPVQTAIIGMQNADTGENESAAPAPIEDVVDIARITAIPPGEQTAPDNIEPPSTNDAAPRAPEMPMQTPPFDSLFTQTAQGPLPKISETDGQTPFEAYRMPPPTVRGGAQLSLVVLDSGINRSRTENLIRTLPAGTAFAFSPYAGAGDTLAIRARRTNKEVWLMLPLETQDYPQTDTGPFSILQGNTVAENNQRIQSVLTSLPGYAGLVATPYHTFNREAIQSIAAFDTTLKAGLPVLDTNVSLPNFIAPQSRRRNLPAAQANYIFSDKESPASLQRKLQDIRNRLENGEPAIVAFTPDPLPVAAARTILQTFTGVDYQLVPLSAQFTDF